MINDNHFFDEEMSEVNWVCRLRVAIPSVVFTEYFLLTEHEKSMLEGVTDQFGWSAILPAGCNFDSVEYITTPSIVDLFRELIGENDSSLASTLRRQVLWLHRLAKEDVPPLDTSDEICSYQDCAQIRRKYSEFCPDHTMANLVVPQYIGA